MFYDRFAYLCKRKGVSASRAALEAGISKSLVTKWKTNNVEVPSPDVLNKLSRYFNLSISELLGEETEKAPADDGKRYPEGCNILKIAGRDGSFRERVLSDQQLAALIAIVDQMPDVPDDL